MLNAAAAEQLEHVLLSWLTEGEPIERQIVLESRQPRGVDAERVRENEPLNPSRPWIHPVWREFTEPLFIGRDRGRLDPQAMTCWLSTVANRTGVIRRQAADQYLPTTPSQQWLRRRGLSVCWLGPPYPWQTATGESDER